MSSKLGRLLQSLRIRKNLSVEKIALRLEGTSLRGIDFERHPEQLPADQLAIYLAALDVTGEEYRDFCEISILEFGKRSNQDRMGLGIRKVIEKLKEKKGSSNGQPWFKASTSPPPVRRKA